MQQRHSTTIAAPATVVWDVLVAVLHWPELTDSITSVEPLDGPDPRVGARYRLKQPRMPTMLWRVIELNPGSDWSWEQRSRTGTTTARHAVEATGARSSQVHLSVRHVGILRLLVGGLTRRQTARYLRQEAQGIRVESERRASEGTAGPGPRHSRWIG